MINLLNPNYSSEENLQRVLLIFEGYRSYFLQYDLAEYHLGSSKYEWFQIGWNMAEKDWAATK